MIIETSRKRYIQTAAGLCNTHPSPHVLSQEKSGLNDTAVSIPKNAYTNANRTDKMKRQQGQKKKKTERRGRGSSNLKLPADEELIQDVVGFVEIKDDVELAHVSKVTVQHLHEQVDLLERDKLVVILIYARHKK